MSTITDALNAAHDLLYADHLLEESLEAARKDRQWFEPTYGQQLKEVSAHLDGVELEAFQAANLCEDAGLTALSNWCKKFAARTSLAKRMGKADRSALDDMKILTAQGRDALDAAEEIAEQYTRV